MNCDVKTGGASDPVAVANTFLVPEFRPLVRLDSTLAEDRQNGTDAQTQ